MFRRRYLASCTSACTNQFSVKNESAQWSQKRICQKRIKNDLTQWSQKRIKNESAQWQISGPLQQRLTEWVFGSKQNSFLKSEGLNRLLSPKQSKIGIQKNGGFQSTKEQETLMLKCTKCLFAEQNANSATDTNFLPASPLTVQPS